jgi:hypothetical protein
MKLTEIKNTTPEIGFVYRILPTPKAGDFSNEEVYVIGFRNAGRQVKVVYHFGKNWEVDNLDLVGPFAIEFDMNSKRAPNSSEIESIKGAEAKQASLQKED